MADSGRLAALLGRIEQARVVCVGDVMLDRFIEGAVDRISPEAPIPIFNIRTETEMPGGAGNVARNIAAFGASAMLFSVIGKDEAGDKLTHIVNATPGLMSAFVTIEARPTTIKTRYVADGQQLLRTDRETVEPISKEFETQLLYDIAEKMPRGRSALVLSDYGKGVLSDMLVSGLIALGAKQDAIVIVDPKGSDYSRYRGADLLTPNRQELASASGMPTGGDQEVVEAARKIIAEAGVKAVLATRSEQGMSLVTADGVTHLPARAREVFDVSGAGDTVVAALAAAYGAGADLADAAALANVAAGVVVGKVGTAVAYPAEILAAMHETEIMDAEGKVATLDAALDRVAGWRRQSLRCGFTNGCFDLLHPGHISLLNQAKAGCDRLVVGLNSDRSVRALKGESRPVQSESSRAQVLASLAAVDLVVVFDEDTPIELIGALKPDLLVKGADYAIDEVVGGDLVKNWGGEVMLAQLLDGHSTTGTIARLNKGES